MTAHSESRGRTFVFEDGWFADGIGKPIDEMVGEPCAHCGDLPVMMELPIPASLSHTGREYVKRVDIDGCIADMIKALNDGGCPTVACCCGHGRSTGRITLVDGRRLIVIPKEATGCQGREQ